MKQRFNILLLSLLLLVAGTFSVSAQIVDAEGQYVDTVFNDHVDRTAEDFVIASLLVPCHGRHDYLGTCVSGLESYPNGRSVDDNSD